MYSPNHGAGTTRCTFDLRIERGVSINHEWRDWRNSPYGVGPSFSIVGDALQTAGKTLLHLPIGKWIHFEIAADLGQKNTGTWTLTVVVPGEPPKVFKDLKNGSTPSRSSRGSASPATPPTKPSSIWTTWRSRISREASVACTVE